MRDCCNSRPRCRSVLVETAQVMVSVLVVRREAIDYLLKSVSMMKERFFGCVRMQGTRNEPCRKRCVLIGEEFSFLP